MKKHEWILKICVNRNTSSSRTTREIQEITSRLIDQPILSLAEAETTARFWVNNYKLQGLKVEWVQAIDPDSNIKHLPAVVSSWDGVVV